MGNKESFTVTFWGVRGSIPAPGPATSRYGGNTSCIEIRCGDELLIIDGGSGLRDLGRKVVQEGHERIDVLFTHTHWDHICGVPFFQPAYIPKISVNFWGVRGSIPAPGPATSRYGGNTSCIEIRCGDELLIIDGGSGLRDLGRKVVQEGHERIDVLFTHTHWDHICGVPFFQPAYIPKISVNFWAGHLSPERQLGDVLCEQMIVPFFPVPIDIFQNCNYHDFPVGTPMPIGTKAKITTCPLNHPNRACGYRIDFDGRSVCVITDTEHTPDAPDETVLRFVQGADVMIYDSMFTDEEFPKFVGWGHSTWQEAVRIAEAANVGRAVLFHHDPNHDDSMMDKIGAKADAKRAGTLVAREGQVLTV